MKYKRGYTGFFWAAFFIALILSVIHTEFDVFLIIKKLPGTTSFVVKSFRRSHPGIISGRNF